MAEKLRRIASLRNMSLLTGKHFFNRNTMRDYGCYRSTLAQRYYLFEDLELILKLEQKRKDGLINKKQAVKIFRELKKQVKGDYADEFLFLDSDGEFKPGVSFKKAHESAERYVSYAFGIYVREDRERAKETLEERIEKTVFSGTHSTTLRELTEDSLPEVKIEGFTPVKWKGKIAYFKDDSQKYITLNQARKLFKTEDFKTTQVNANFQGLPMKVVLVSFDEILSKTRNKRLQRQVKLKFFQKEVLTK